MDAETKAAYESLKAPYKANGTNGAFAQADKDTTTVKLTRATDVQMQAISWIWPGWLARGKMHLIGGQPGTGKTTIALALAAIITQAGVWPDGYTSPLGKVVIWSGEDDPADTLLPRLLAAGADPDNIFFVETAIERGQERPFDPAKDLPALRDAILSTGGVKLIIVDPIVSAVAGDSHKNTETRRALQPLADLAAEIGAALIGITHFTKGTSGREPIERVNGSIAFGALARVVMVAAKEQPGEDGTSRRIFARAKSNIGPDEGGFAYSLEQMAVPDHDEIIASVAIFGEKIEGSAREILAAAEGDDQDERRGGDAQREAEDFLRDLLSGGPVCVKQIKTSARDAAQSWRTIERAKAALSIAARKDGPDGSWTWRLPDETAPNSPPA